MARTHARILTTAWHDPAFTELTTGEQWTFFMLISQADISNCGVIAYRPKRWARLAGGLDTVTLEENLAQLEARGMVMIDEETDELWIRSFVKNDGILKHPNMIRSMRAAFGQVMSDAIRAAFLAAYPPPETTHRDAIETPSETHQDGIGMASGCHSSGLPDFDGDGVGDGVVVGEGLTATRTLRGDENDSSPEPPSSIDTKRLCSEYVAWYRSAHGAAPPPKYIGWLSKAIADANAGLCSDVEIRNAVHRIATAGKRPSTLLDVIGDYRRDKVGAA